MLSRYFKLPYLILTWDVQPRHASRHPEPCSQPFQEPVHPPVIKPCFGTPGPYNQTPGPVSTCCSLAITRGPGFTHQWVGNSFGDFWTLPLLNSNQHYPWDPYGFHSQPLHDPVPPTSSWQPPHRWPAKLQTTHIACHKKETLTGANIAAFRSGDTRGMYCWEVQDNSYKRPLCQVRTCN